MKREIVFRLGGDKALVVELGDSIDETVNERVRALALAISKQIAGAITEVVPTYRSLLLFYDPLVISLPELKAEILKLEEAMDKIPLPPPLLYKVPTLYGGSFGPDLPFVAAHNSLDQKEVVRLHTSTSYRIYMLGFTPGFCYLGGMPPAIATPRLDNPRTSIAAGSVGIAGAQTGIYPIDSPGGWRIIGATPLCLFDPGSHTPFVFSAGDYLRFISISGEEFSYIKEQVRQGLYRQQAEEFAHEGP
jgi:KipI family sensor histidine kinase inhibitor